MKANELLFWLSARNEGSWARFRGAVEELHASDEDLGSTTVPEDDVSEFPLHQKLRSNFECLAHAEFFERNSKLSWRVAPPILAAHQVAEGFRAVLCGARSPALCDRLYLNAEKLNREISVVDGAPNVMRITAKDNATLANLASTIGVKFQSYAPLAIISRLRQCSNPTRKQLQSELPFGDGWNIREFNPVTLGWRAVDRKRAESIGTGLFEFQLFNHWRYFLRWRKGTFELPRAVAVYILLHRDQRLLTYDSEKRALSLPGTCRPPHLLERALVLCSGLPPTFDPGTSRLTYSDVPIDIARLSASLLRQSIR